MTSTKVGDEPPSASKWIVEIPSHTDDAAFGGCRSIERNYRKQKVIGKGTYGEVFLATDERTGAQMALKKIRMENEKEGFPITAMREIKLLKRLKHDNVICMKEIVRSQAHSVNNMKGSIYMVLDYMDHDLTGLMQRVKHKLSVAHAKCYIKQLLQGLHYCHSQRVLHRDLKLSNLLVNNHGILKIGDFGLARIMDLIDDRAQLTNKVITLWYRPPELLLGARSYGPEIDLWSVGCIIVEILTGQPLFPAETEAEELDKICKVMGNITERTMPGCTSLPQYSLAKQDYRRNSLKNHLASRKLSELAIDLVANLLALDPKKRMSAIDAYRHPYFLEAPQAAHPHQLPQWPASHEKVMKELRDAKKVQHGTSSDGNGKRSHAQLQGHSHLETQKRPRTTIEGHLQPAMDRPYLHHPVHTGPAPPSMPHSLRTDAGYRTQDSRPPYGTRLPMHPPIPHMAEGMYGFQQNQNAYGPSAAHAQHAGHPASHRQDYQGQRGSGYGEQPSWAGRKR